MVSSSELIDSIQETDLTTVLNVDEPRADVPSSGPTTEPLYDLRSVAESYLAAGLILTLIETRGEGGLFLCHPTPRYELQQKQLTEIPTLTSGEREFLLQSARELGEY